jgi:hypothetical protein
MYDKRFAFLLHMVPKGGAPLETPAAKPPGRRYAASQQSGGWPRSPCLTTVAESPTGCSPSRSEQREPRTSLQAWAHTAHFLQAAFSVARRSRCARAVARIEPRWAPR